MSSVLLLPLYCIGYGFSSAGGDRSLTSLYAGLIIGESVILGKVLFYGAYVPGADTLTVRLAQFILTAMGAVQSIVFFFQFVTDRNRR